MRHPITHIHSAAQSKLDTQPKGIATSSEGTAFIAELSKIVAFRSNQKVAELHVKYEPTSISTTGNLVAVGGEVWYTHFFCCRGCSNEIDVCVGTQGALL